MVKIFFILILFRGLFWYDLNLVEFSKKLTTISDKIQKIQELLLDDKISAEDNGGWECLKSKKRTLKIPGWTPKAKSTI